MNTPMSRADLARLIGVALIWGSSFLFMKVALDGLSDIQIVLIRTLLGAGVLWFVLRLRRVRLPRDRWAWIHLLVLGAIGTAMPFFLFVWAEDNGVSSGLAGIYNATTPLWTMLLALLLLAEERIVPARIGGLVLGFVGVITVLAPWQGVGGGNLLGQLACLAAGLAYGVSLIYNRRNLPRYGIGPLPAAFGMSIGAAGWSTVMAGGIGWQPVHLTWPVVLCVGALGVFGTGIAYLLFFGLLSNVGATRASTVTYVIPLVAVALGVLILGEHVAWYHFVGGAIVVLGIAVAEQRLRLPVRLLPARLRPTRAPEPDRAPAT
ncbi:MAG TPA: DMT family transporter [Actinomycetes bacterium]|nr:DMT family transporter [Actinomycetes bacterium]